MKKLMVAAVAGAMALGALAGSFLDDLADPEKHPELVSHSPVATGGDLIYHIVDESAGIEDYVHIFTNPAPAEAYSFELSESRKVAYLAVGGAGGGGNRGGGGGAGGMLNVPSYVFLKGAYEVAVGAGGAGGAARYAQGSNGGDSFAKFGEKDVFRARGGGGGGSNGYDGQTVSRNAGRDGGSGGGSAKASALVGASEPGQGHNGGASALPADSPSKNCKHGGGGGAGAAGAGSTGGSGLQSEILGFEQYFAGGGAGGGESGADGASGGLGGGAASGGTASAGNAGEDGLGGGGSGGGGNANFGFQNGGRGGSGIVVIRYAAYEEPSPDPFVTLDKVTPNDDATATIDWTLGDLGVDAESCDVFAAWGYDSDALCHTNQFAEGAGLGSQTSGLSGLLPGRTYFIGIFAVNDKGANSGLTDVKSFTMPEDGLMPDNPPVEQPVVSAKTVTDKTGDDYVFVGVELSKAGQGCSFAGCTATLRWGLRNAYVSLTESQTLQVGEDGRVEFKPEGLVNEQLYYAVVEVVNANGYIDRTAIFSFCALDDSVYRWKEGVTEGDWADRNNWTGAPNDRGIGYPLNKATADFTSVLCATVHVSGVVTCAAFKKEKTSGKYVFIGETDDAEIRPSDCARDDSGNVLVTLQGRQTLVFDHVKTILRSYDVWRYALVDNDRLVLLHGATATVKRSKDNTIMGFEMKGSNARLEIDDRSSLECSYSSVYGHSVGGAVRVSNGSWIGAGGRDVYLDGGTTLTLDNGKLTSVRDLLLAETPKGTSTSSRKETELVLKGTNVQIAVSQSAKATLTNANVVCEIPAEGWGSAIIRGSATDASKAKPFGEGGLTITFSVPETAPIRNSHEKSSRESCILSWNLGIDTSCVEFGKTAKSSDYFYYTEIDAADAPRYLNAAEAEGKTVKYIWYHHDFARGMMLFVK